MGLVFLWLVLAFATQIWLCFRVARSSVVLAIATFFLGFPPAIITLVKRYGDDQTSVTLPFLVNLVFTVLLIVSVKPYVMDAVVRAEAVVASEPSSQAPVPIVRDASASSAMAAGADATLAASTPQSASSAASAASAMPANDPVGNFSSALSAAGIVHTLTRLDASADLPTGVTDAAQIAAQPAASAAASAAASSPTQAEYSVTLLRCESAAVCRNLAGTYMQQGDGTKRVLQNGLLLLLIPVIEAGNTSDVTPLAVASVFRKM